LERQIRCFPYVELSDVPPLQQFEKSRRPAEESRTTNLNTQLNTTITEKDCQSYKVAEK
jgi:hypothetical protein